MKKTIFLIFIIIIFILIDLFTGFLVFIDYLKELKTIKIDSQGEVIAQQIKEHFNIDYNITKVTFQSGIPDGYYLDIYDENNQIQSVFEDNHEDSEIYHYFDDVKPDIPEHFKYLILELIIEIYIIKAIVGNKRRNE